MMIKCLRKWTIKAKIVPDINIRENNFIPRIITSPIEKTWPLTLKEAISINIMFCNDYKKKSRAITPIGWGLFKTTNILTWSVGMGAKHFLIKVILAC